MPKMVEPIALPFLFNLFNESLNKLHSVDSPLWGKYSTLHTFSNQPAGMPTQN